MKINPSQLRSLLAAYIPARLPVLITGACGTGKSDIVEQAAKAAGHDLLISHPVVEDPTDSKGLPFPNSDGSAARFLPFGDLEQALNAKCPLVWFIDDLGQASPSVQAAKMQLLLARKIGEHRLPEHVTFVAATNRRIDNAGVSNILDPLKSRFATIVELEPSIQAWTEWAVSNDVTPELIAFLRFRPALLSTDQKTKELENLPSPRGWGSVARQLPVVPKGLELEAIAGAVGEAAAAEFIAFRQIYQHLPSIDGILTAPDVAPIPTNLSALCAISTALGQAAHPNNFDRVMVYAHRMMAEGYGEYAVMLCSDAVRRNSEICATPAWIMAQGTEFGRLIMGNH
ncbi:ATP-binding protein [Cupriavidus sp. D39]|uniref:ATP-binding protein n=1 Tax=Cupriavidus sp. D39 TaxID=2997877 RepID=UPI00226D6C5B|nr:ATP-binding protein [Cupriavidus sp. D39]MCY0852468.1 ATP-binding protein [Cupriavidus sp. D39]